MPVLIQSKTYSDLFSVARTFYKANAGDVQTAEIVLTSSIRLSSLNSNWTLDPSQNIITNLTDSWLEEGFRVGDAVNFTIYSAGGGIITSWSTLVTYVDNVNLDVNAVPQWINPASGEFIVASVTSRGRDDMDVFFNLSQNNVVGSVLSLIDGEATRITFLGLNSLPVSNTIAGLLSNFQSGQAVYSAEITRNTNVDAGTRKYTIEIVFANTGFYDQSWFLSNECLKPIYRIEWASISGEPFARTIVTINDAADSGWFNEPFNSGIFNATLISAPDEISYCDPTTIIFSVDTTFTDFGIGACYIATDDAYYKNRQFPQQVLTMLTATTEVSNFPTTSSINEFNAAYDISIVSQNTIGTITTFEILITPNVDFDSFFSSLEDGDRLFYLWVRAGDLNLLVYADQLECAPPVGGPLIMENSFAYLDHSENIVEVSGDSDNYSHNTEDDLAYYGTFLIRKGDVLQSFSARLIARDQVTGEKFTLQQSTFNLGAIPVSNDGVTLINLQQTIVTTLPNTSEKRICLFRRKPSLDTSIDFGMEIYLPFLSRWEFWLPQLNASVDFYPDQNKNWFPYDNTGDWKVQVELELVKEGLSFTHYASGNIKDYDSEIYLQNSIELYDDFTNTQVSAVLINQLMRVVAFHEILLNAQWDQPSVWGTITVEPLLGAPRSICSSVVPFDNNLGNPLSPLSGSFLSVTYPAPNIARFECYFNPDLINLSNGVKFTSKIKGCIQEAVIITEKTTSPDGIVKTTTFSTNKTLSI